MMHFQKASSGHVSAPRCLEHHRCVFLPCETKMLAMPSPLSLDDADCCSATLQELPGISTSMQCSPSGLDGGSSASELSKLGHGRVPAPRSLQEYGTEAVVSKTLLLSRTSPARLYQCGALLLSG